MTKDGIKVEELPMNKRDKHRRGSGVVYAASVSGEVLQHVLRGLTTGFDAMNVGVTVTDADGTIVYVNEIEAALHSRSVEELVGQDVGVLAPAGKRKPLSRAQLKQLKSWKRESENVRKDGTVFPVMLRSDVIVDSAEEPIGIVTTCEDIGELQNTRNALQRTEADYTALVENTNYGICRCSVEGRFLNVNRAMVKMLGYETKTELLETNLATNIFTNPEEFAELLDLCSDPGVTADLEVVWTAKDGEKRTVRVTGRAARSQIGELENFEFIAEDVTRRRELEAQLRQAQKLEALGQLTGGIAHDFNNILTVIQANIALITHDLPDGAEEARNELRETLKATRRGADLVKKLLAFSRREELSRELVDMTQLVSGAAKTLTRLLPENIEIKVVAAESVGTVFADPNAVEQILLNLATNARDAMPEGGLLYVETRRAWLQEEHRPNFGHGRAGEYACIIVSDTGSGMDETTKQKLFEPFYTTKSAGKGTGLGMAMIHGLVKQHNGFVHVYSELDNGTTVKVYFPLARRESTDEASSGHELDIDNSLEGTETILVVEDEPQIRDVARRVLERRGYTVILAENGEEGVRQFREYRSDIALVISDVIMPKLGGPAMYDAIKEFAPDTRFMFMSGHAAHVLRVSGNVDPHLPFLYKPWTGVELLKRVRELLDQAPLTWHPLEQMQ
jgi:PAS domain S-box-containing protein